MKTKIEITIDVWRSILIAEATRYDLRQSKGTRYNPWAIGKYFEGIDNALKSPTFLDDPKKALAQEFSIENERGGIYHRSLPADFSGVRFELSFLNMAIRKIEGLKGTPAGGLK